MKSDNTQEVAVEEIFHSMEEFQKTYFPDKVGVECPYCGKPYKPVESLVILPGTGRGEQ